MIHNASEEEGLIDSKMRKRAGKKRRKGKGKETQKGGGKKEILNNEKGSTS